MTTSDRGQATSTTGLYAEFPKYNLTCVVDDPDQPTELTLFPENDVAQTCTQWISIDAAHAVPLRKTL
jgi:hypothetical protein